MPFDNQNVSMLLGVMAILYSAPGNWIAYNHNEIVRELIEAKSAILALTNIPYQRSWADALQELELKREVAGTSKIEGADFTDRELEEAISDSSAETKLSRSQKQARAAIHTYKWIASISRERPITGTLIEEIHRRIVTGCDDDHCEPGALRKDDHNVTFGRPRHRGASGGTECAAAFNRLCQAVQHEYLSHDTLIQALAAHYHIGAIHPFGDGNGRTARALEALLLRRSDLKDTLFIAMSNYYYDEKEEYLQTLGAVAAKRHELTAFLKFGLRGIASQCNRLLSKIKRNIAKSLYRDVMSKMYGRLQSTRKRVLADRQLKILEYLLEKNKSLNAAELRKYMLGAYVNLKEGDSAFIRDVNQLIALRAISVWRNQETKLAGLGAYELQIRLEWPMEITETMFFAEIEKMPQAKTRLIIT